MKELLEERNIDNEIQIIGGLVFTVCKTILLLLENPSV